jgi:hypothetical protein
MSRAINDALDEARGARTAGNAGLAEKTYAHAAALARSEGNPALRAHALRHVSDLARERGAHGEAPAAAKEAAALYRTAPDARPLDLANALRLNALALGGVAGGNETAFLWREARALYLHAQVTAGVDECDRHLDP